MKLYVWEEVLCDYTCGVIFALANNVDEARELVVKKYASCPGDEWEESSLMSPMQEEPKVYDASEGFRVRGGG